MASSVYASSARDALPIPNTAGSVITKLEDIFESITDCLLEKNKELTICLKTRPPKVTQEDETGNRKRLMSGVRKITFPSRNPKEAWKFSAFFFTDGELNCCSYGTAALLRILELSHEALVTGVVTTKRDIYYRDPELFVKQAVVDRYVDDIAYTLGVERDALNVVAAAKGLVAGAFSLTRKDKSRIDYSEEIEGTLVPSTKEKLDIELNEVKWILVIEKEAKGYPDIQTRQFLHLLWAQNPDIPIFALVDFDPDGLGIMSTYKYGSMALSHETINLAVPTIKWLGIRSSDFIADDDCQGLLRLSARDRRIARKMLEKDMFEEGGNEIEWRRELQVMLMLNVKAEIQILGNGEKLSQWLDGKLANEISDS
ncbi:DNA topoisomerase IV, alpha subunit [Glarea lozoyensis ATCC 20868]|uniref:DNA topoisomerase (ATP-hydrolyzing) n=1 Tax=Glarea lozoyensis (strain ATCC 20868 / MF5171) TaxID=1116229 RepID=S3D4Y5_GLAL2|nr:DNA topoisomerase IV, alpha subunit [Glarea lozoyensis ATCC 20868]EPE33517.1 DNA topoisomerase IV, alpha subunit [Glarea lozoyensis ATCC 20868]